MREASFKNHLYLEMQENETIAEVEERMRKILDALELEVKGFSYTLHEIEEQTS